MYTVKFSPHFNRIGTSCWAPSKGFTSSTGGVFTREAWLAYFDQKNGFASGQCLPQGCFRDSQHRWWIPTHDRTMVIPETQFLRFLKPVETGI